MNSQTSYQKNHIEISHELRSITIFNFHSQWILQQLKLNKRIKNRFKLADIETLKFPIYL